MNTERPATNLAQRAFLAAERAGNRVFGDRLNPLYHLGTIGYFLFWVVAVSGIILYALFETSATQAHASVARLAEAPLALGTILRGLHRYASDALMAVMLLHLARHLAFGRHRGHRWLAWITGLVLLALASVAGINGFMLPWDRLAQFVTTAATEWLDALPMIGGALSRNFISNAAVGDRLFSLLAFIHIGVSLVFLALLWVHTQRTPAARTSPPRTVMTAVCLTLVAMSLAAPVISLAPADLGQQDATLPLDWFYLPVLAWAHGGSSNAAGNAVAAWAALAVAGLLFAMLPWLGARRPAARGARTRHDIAVHPDERILSARAGETLLDAGLREGLAMPFDCRNGGCGACKADLLDGEVRLQPYQPSALSDAERAAGKTLLCCAEPVSDVEIRYTPAPGAPRALPRRYEAMVARLDRLTPDVMRLTLRIVSGGALRFHAGQYLNIVLEDGARRSFSFATAPGAAVDGGDIELHVRHIEGGRFTSAVFGAMQAGDRITFEGPLGTFTLREQGGKPILFVAGSTGFAPVKSMVEHAFATGLARPMTLYWGVRRPADLYLRELAEKWATEHANFRFIPVISAPAPEDAWTGRTGLVHEAILADYPDLSAQQVYACGSVGMVETATPAFADRGLSADDCFSDAFRLAPHAPRQGQASEMVRLGGAHG